MIGKKFQLMILLFNLLINKLINNMFIGIVLLLLGVSFLLKNLGVLTDVTWSIVWPIILVVLGLMMMFRKRKRFWE